MNIITKLEKVEKNLRSKRWSKFVFTKTGRMSWADWFYLSVINRKFDTK